MVDDQEWHSRGVKFGRALTLAREAASLSHTALGAAVGRGTSQVYKYESGETVPRADIAIAMEAACRVEPGRLTRILGSSP